MKPVFDAYAAYYDLLYRDKDYRGEAGYVHDLLARHGVGAGRLLELGCGTGRHAEHLARLGYSVHGIDSSPGMVEKARERLPAAPGSGVRFEVGDVRTSRLGTLFDAVISLFHVVSYQSSNEDLAAMLATAGAHLHEGGLFVFDCWYGPAVLTDPPTVRIRRLDDGPVRILRVAEPTLHPNENLVDVSYTVLVTNDPAEPAAEIRETHRMRYLFLPELRAMLKSAGMRLWHAEEWLSGRELTRASWQAVVVAQRIAGGAQELNE